MTEPTMAPSFIQAPDNPAPEGTRFFTFNGADGAKLRGAHFPIESPRASVLLLTGRTEFIEKYFETVRDLQSRGFSVAMMDWRGQGLTERALPDTQKGHITDFSDFRSDLLIFFNQHMRTDFPGPYVLMTHSMGGAPALQILGDGNDNFCAAVLCAPMTQIAGGFSRRLTARVASSLAKALGRGDGVVPGVKEHAFVFEDNDLTTDKTRHDVFRLLQENTPEAIIRSPTYSWVKAAIAAIDDLHKPGRFDGLKTPICIVSAGRDTFVDTDDHALIASQSPLIERKLVDGSLHEILMEQDPLRDQFWSAFDGFVEPILAQQSPSSV